MAISRTKASAERIDEVLSVDIGFDDQARSKSRIYLLSRAKSNTDMLPFPILGQINGSEKIFRFH